MWIGELTGSIGFFMKKNCFDNFILKKNKNRAFLNKKELDRSLVDSPSHSRLTGSTL
jgi:hypothetical protein